MCFSELKKEIDRIFNDLQEVEMSKATEEEKKRQINLLLAQKEMLIHKYAREHPVKFKT